MRHYFCLLTLGAYLHIISAAAAENRKIFNILDTRQKQYSIKRFVVFCETKRNGTLRSGSQSWLMREIYILACDKKGKSKY